MKAEEVVAASARTSGVLSGIGRRAIVVLAITSMLGIAAIGSAVSGTTTPAGAAGVARDGLSAEHRLTVVLVDQAELPRQAPTASTGCGRRS